LGKKYDKVASDLVHIQCTKSISIK